MTPPELTVTVRARVAWWYQPAMRLLTRAALLHLVGYDRAMRIATGLSYRAVRYRIGTGRWRRFRRMA